MTVCVKCQRMMKVKKVGEYFVEVVKGPLRKEGTAYKLWSGDVWECQECGNKVILTNERQHPVMESWEEYFAERISEVKMQAKDWDVE